MTTTETKPFYSTHRVLKAEEIYILATFEQHKGLDPLKHSSAEMRMRPIPYDESFLFESGYLVQGTSAGNKPMRGTARITPEGRQALRMHFARALADLEKRKKDKDIPDRQREIFEQLSTRLKAFGSRYEEDESDIDPETPSPRAAAPTRRRGATPAKAPKPGAGKAAEEVEDVPAPEAKAGSKPPRKRR